MAIMNSWRAYFYSTRLGGVSLLILCITALLITLDLSPYGIQKAEAAGLRLFSSEYPISKSGDVKQRVVVNSEAQHCLLFSLSDDTLSVTVRFAYSSNTSYTAKHLPLVVTTHFPSAPFSGEIFLHDESNIMDTHVFEHLDLEFDPKSDAAKEGKRKKIDVKMHALRTDGTGAAVTYSTIKEDVMVLPGAYGMCFGLDNPFFNALSASPPEMVVIDIHSVIFGRERREGRPGGRSRESSTGSAGNPAFKSRAALSGADQDANDAFEEGVRKLYRAEDNEDVAKLISRKDFVPYAVLRNQLQQVDEALNKLTRVQDLARWQREREQDMRHTSESTFTRIWLSGILLFIAVSCLTHYVFSFAKNYMVKQKLI